MKYQISQIIELNGIGKYTVTDTMVENELEYYFIYNYDELENGFNHEEIQKLILVYDKVKNEQYLEKDIEKITNILMNFSKGE